MSYNDYREMTGRNARSSTTLLMKSLKEVLKESGADKHLLTDETQPPRGVQPMPPEMAEAIKTQPGQPMPAPAAQPRAELERPVCLQSGKRKGLFSRLFG